MRRVTLTFADGSKHVYEGVPDDATPADVQQRARRDFPSLKLTNIDGGQGIPYQKQANVAPPVGPALPDPNAPPPSLADQVIGAGEAGLTALTGAVGGTTGMVGGAIGGLAGALATGEFGTDQGARRVADAAAQGAQALTYMPRTADGQAKAAALGEVLQAALPVMPLTAEVGAMTAAAGPIASGIRARGAAAVDRAGQAAQQVIQRVQDRAPQAPVQAAMPVEQLAQAARRAGEGGIGSEKASRILAEQAAPDAAVVKSAERLGVQEYLQPDHVTTNEAFRQVTAAIKSNPLSQVALAEREGLARVSERAARLVDELGGSRDVSAVDLDLRTRLQRDTAALDASAEKLYGQLREGVPARASVEAPNVLRFIEQRARDLGGEENLSGMERMILRKLSPKAAPAETAAVADAGSVIPPLADFVKRQRIADEKLPPKVKDEFIGWLKSVGGVDIARKYDITGERSGVLSNPGGIFRKGGRGADTLAILAEEEGFLLPGQGADSAAFIELVQSAIRGDQPKTLQRMGDYAARDAAMGQRDARLAAAEKRLRVLGVNPDAARGNVAAMEAYLDRYQEPLMRMATDEARQRGAASDLPQYQELQQRAQQMAADIQESARTLPQWEAEVQPLSPVMRKMVADELRRQGIETPEPAQAAAPGVGPTYALLDDVRRDLTAAKYKRQGPFKDADTGLIKKLEGELMSDQRAAVEPYGMLDVFDAARAAVRTRKGLEDDLSALFGRNLDRSMVGGGQVGLGGAMSALARGDSAALVRLLEHVPKDMRQQVVASGLATVFRKAASRGELDFTGFVKWYEGLKRNRQSYSAVMSNLPLGSAKQIEALYRVSRGVSDSLNRRIKTGALNTIKAEMMGGDGLMESLYAMARRTGAGVAAEAITTPAGIPGAGVAAALGSALTRGKGKPLAAVDELIASPEFAQLVQQQAAGKPVTPAVRKVARSRTFSRVVNELGKPAELSDRELWILQALQVGSQPQQAKDQQRTLH